MRPGHILPRAFYEGGAEEIARELLGCFLVRRFADRRKADLAVRIIETEAYLGEGDRASHAWRGRPTQRTATLFRQGGCAYVYLVYGLHHLFNVVTGPAGKGTAVLVRAGEPVTGVEQMARHRRLAPGHGAGAIAGGPGKLTEALQIDRGHDGSSLLRGEIVIRRGSRPPDQRIAVGPRVGVDYAGKAAAWPLRFAERGNPHVSRPRPW